MKGKRHIQNFKQHRLSKPLHKHYEGRRVIAYELDAVIHRSKMASNLRHIISNAMYKHPSPISDQQIIIL